MKCSGFAIYRLLSRTSAVSRKHLPGPSDLPGQAAAGGSDLSDHGALLLLLLFLRRGFRGEIPFHGSKYTEGQRIEPALVTECDRGTDCSLRGVQKEEELSEGAPAILFWAFQGLQCGLFLLGARALQGCLKVLV